MNKVNTKVTLPKGYVVLNKGNEKNSNINNIVKLLSKLEKSNIVLDSDAIITLSTLNENEFNSVSKNLIDHYSKLSGQFLRPVFASSDIELEEMTSEDYYVQFWMYFNTYGIGRFPEELFEVDSNRKVDISKISNKKDTQDINNTFKIVTIKSVNEFAEEVLTIVNTPVVFGIQQEEFIFEAYKVGILGDIIENSNIKVKENLFSILDITGKEFFKNYNILRTATDVLRYAYFVSSLDYRELPKGIKFTLKTSDKKVIMNALNKIADRDVLNTFGEMKPYKSQWLSLSKNLFPGSKKFSRFTKAQGIFQYLRNGGNVETFNTVTQRLIEENKIILLTKHLSAKPGVLIRSLDMIIRKADKNDVDVIVDIISDIKFNPKLIIQVKKWLEYRVSNGFKERIFNVKGKPVTVTDRPLKELKTKRTTKVVNALNNTMIEHLKGKELFPLKEVA